MKEGINRVRARNSKIASELKKHHYPTAVHALPPNIKARLDQMFSWRVSPETALKTLSNEFPDIKFPSIPAVYNYRKKYFRPTLTRALTKIAEKEVKIDLKKQKIEDSLADRYVVMATVLLPALEAGALAALDQAKQIKLPLRVVVEWIMAYKEVAKELREFASRNDMRLFVKETQVVGAVSGDEEEDRKEGADELFRKILSKKGFQLGIVTRTVVGVQQGGIQKVS